MIKLQNLRTATLACLYLPYSKSLLWFQYLYTGKYYAVILVIILRRRTNMICTVFIVCNGPILHMQSLSLTYYT